MKELPESPLSTTGATKNCCELIIYDNDGPEGFFYRCRAKTSAELIKIIIESFSAEELSDYNFKITNYWTQIDSES